MSEWQPIRTAPKYEGKIMLGIVRHGRLEEIHLGGYCFAVNEDEVSCWWSDQCDDEIIPTHWQPHPGEPTSGEPTPRTEVARKLVERLYATEAHARIIQGDEEQPLTVLLRDVRQYLEAALSEHEGRGE